MKDCLRELGLKTILKELDLGWTEQETVPLLIKGISSALMFYGRNRKKAGWNSPTYTDGWRELFHEALVALWNSVREYREKLANGGIKVPPLPVFVQRKVKWHIVNFCAANHRRYAPGQRWPLTKTFREEAERESQLLIQEESISEDEELKPIVDRIIAILARTGVQGDGKRQPRPDCLARYRKLIILVASGYTGEEIARVFGWAGGRSSANFILRRIRQKLVNDSEFMAEFEDKINGRKGRHHLPELREKWREKRRNRLGYRKSETQMPPNSSKLKRIENPEFCRMSLKEIMASYDVAKSTAWKAQKRGWLIVGKVKPSRRGKQV